MRLKYNPGLHEVEELLRTFVVRQPSFEILLETIRENTEPANQHVLVVGPRGSGKTTLVLRVAAEIRSDPDLAASWYPIVFAEESYMISNAGELWLEALFHLADQTGDERWDQAFRELRQERDEKRLRDRALAQLMDFADQTGRRLLVVVENLNMLLGEQMTEGADWELRHTLQVEPRVMLLGTATNRFHEIDNINRAWFELFSIHELKPLSQEECGNLWEFHTGSNLPAFKLRPIQIITGGNPRLLNILAGFSTHRSLKGLMDSLVQLVDEHTEYFKSRLDGFAPMERKVFAALLEIWDPATAKEVGQAARMDVSQVSVHLGRLVQCGAVEVVKVEGRRKIYQAAERLYNIYYLLRRRGLPASRIRAAVTFMAHFYEERNLVTVMVDLAKEAGRMPLESRGDHYWTYLELLERIEDGGLKSTIVLETINAARDFFLGDDVPYSIREVLIDLQPPNAKQLEGIVARPERIAEGRSTLDLDKLVFFVDTAATDSPAAVSELLIGLAAAGRAHDVLEVLSSSRSGAALEPLRVGLRLFLGEHPRKAPEILAIGADVARRITELQIEIASSGAPVEARAR